ncbi:MAG: FG-GAP repeat domain-containing protein [Phycisphaerales bacterium]
MGIRHLLCGVVSATLAAAGAAATQEPLFQAPWRAFDTGDFPTFAVNSMTSGDVDGDQDVDVLCAHEYFGGPGFALLRSRGDGTFEAPEIYELPFNSSVFDMALVDYDFDGDLDALATIPDSWGLTNLFAVWPNNGSGVFGGRRDFLAGPGPRGMVVADLDGDGFPDVATADGGYLSQGYTVSVMLHNGRTGGSAAFGPPRSFVVDEFIERLAAADVDGDGDLDLGVGRLSGSGHAILLNDGSGAFGSPTYYAQAPGGSNISPAIAFADVNNDGFPDLISGGASNGIPNYGLIAVRLNDRSGRFGPAQTYRLPDWSWIPKRISTGDINGDGSVDIVPVTPSGRTMDGYYTLINNGSGVFGTATFYEAAKQTFDALVIDADGDGDRDILTGANDSSVLTVHPNPGDGRFLILPRFLVGRISRAMDHGDIDLDGDIDLVTADTAIRILRNAGDGTFAPATEYRAPIIPNSVKLRDLNNDGYLDLVMGSNSAATALNNGDGTFASSVFIPFGGSQVGVVDAFDLDNDGFKDIVLTDPGPAHLIHLARNTAQGQAYMIMPPLNPGSIPWGLGGADLNHDGNIDLVSSIALGLSVFPGNGDFTFRGVLAEGVQAFHFVLTDLNNDGDEDIAALLSQGSFGTTEIATMLGYGDGDFAFPVIVPGPTGRESAFRIATEVDAADVTGDGVIDVIVTANAPNDVSVYAGLGDGGLAEADRYGAGYSASYSSIADFTGDGVSDLATLMSLPPGGFQDSIVILEGLGSSGGGLTLNIQGVCPGQMTLRATGARPDATVAFLYAFGRGSVSIPPGNPCAGTKLGLDATATLLRTARADASGVAAVSGEAPANACDRVFLQALDVSTCEVSNVEIL